MSVYSQWLDYHVIHILPICISVLLEIIYLMRLSFHIQDFWSSPPHEISFDSRIIGLRGAQVDQLNVRDIPTIHHHKGL